MQKIASERSQKAVQALRKSSPKDRGKYAEGWTAGKGSVQKHIFNVIVHNEKYWPLTWILENGHILRQGGRSPTIPHIGPVEKQTIEEYEKQLEEELTNGK